MKQDQVEQTHAMINAGHVVRVGTFWLQDVEKVDKNGVVIDNFDRFK